MPHKENHKRGSTSFPEDREKFGTEFMDNLEDSAVGKFFDLSGERQQVIDQASREGKLGKVSQFTQKIEDKVGQTVAPVLKPVGAALGKISDVTQIDERISTPLTFVAAGAAAKGISKIKPHHVGFTQTIERYTPPKSIGKVPRKTINITQQVDDVMNQRPFTTAEVVKVAKINNISFVQAEEYLKLKLTGFEPTGTLKPGSSRLSRGYRKDGIFDPNRDDTIMYSSTSNNSPSLLIGNILNIGDKGFRYGKGINKLTAPEFIDQRFQTYGFRKGPNGGWLLDRDTYKGLSSNQQREIIQIMQTSVDQTVPQSFTVDKLKKNVKLNKDLADYNKKYGARAELHHSFPSALSSEFFLDKEYMGPEWRELIRIANDEFGNYPGQPFGVDNNSNLVAVPSKIGSNHPNYDAVVAKFDKVPPHLHNIIHSQYFANETGMSGKKFFTQDKLAKMDEGFEGELEVWREWNGIIKRNREMWEEALAQLDVFFSKASLSENPEKLAELLEQYLAKGKITVGQGLVRDKDGNVVLATKGTDTALGKMQTATYAQFPVNDIVKASLADFKKDANKLFNQDPRLADTSKEVATIPGLTENEILKAETLLLKITHYNSILLTAGKSRAYQVTGTSAAQHAKNIKDYKELIQFKIPNLPLDDTFLQMRVFPDVKLPSIEKQMELILETPSQLEINLKNE